MQTLCSNTGVDLEDRLKDNDRSLINIEDCEFIMQKEDKKEHDDHEEHVHHIVAKF